MIPFISASSRAQSHRKYLDQLYVAVFPPKCGIFLKFSIWEASIT